MLQNFSYTHSWVVFLSHLQDVSWGTATLLDAEKRLLSNALLDFSNERFVLLSESCIPVYDFPTVYKYLTGSALSFVDSYDDPSRYGRGRYSRKMLPLIHLRHWRKGSQWFELNRALAVPIISDTLYHDLFSRFCLPACYPDEHYIPTFVNMFHGSLNSNRTVTWVDWSLGGPHPATFRRDNITVEFIQSIRNNMTHCEQNSEVVSVCYLFARKFDPSALEPLLNLSLVVMGFWKLFCFYRSEILNYFWDFDREYNNFAVPSMILYWSVDSVQVVLENFVFSAREYLVAETDSSPC